MSAKKENKYRYLLWIFILTCFVSIAGGMILWVAKPHFRVYTYQVIFFVSPTNIQEWCLKDIDKYGELALPLHIMALEHEKQEIRILGTNGIQKLKSSAAPATLDLLNCVRKYPKMSHHVRRSLASIGKPAIPILVKYMKSTDSEDRSWAIWALAYVGSDTLPLLPGFIEVLENDKDTDVRCSALLAIGSLRWRAALAIPALMKALEDPNYRIRLRSIIALKFIGDKALKPEYGVLLALRNALKDPNEEVRANAAHALRDLEYRLDNLKAK